MALYCLCCHHQYHYFEYASYLFYLFNIFYSMSFLRCIKKILLHLYKLLQSTLVSCHLILGFLFLFACFFSSSRLPLMGNLVSILVHRTITSLPWILGCMWLVLTNKMLIKWCKFGLEMYLHNELSTDTLVFCHERKTSILTSILAPRGSAEPSLHGRDQYTSQMGAQGPQLR